MGSMNNKRNITLTVLFLSFLLLSQGVGASLTATPNPPAATNTVIDIGQNTVINTLITGGFAAYTSNWLWVSPNSVTDLALSTKVGNTISIQTSNTYPFNVVQLIVSPISANQLVIFPTNGVTASSANILSTAGTYIYGNWLFSANVFDGNGGVGVNTVSTQARLITVNPALVLGTRTISNVLIDQGQTETLTVSVSGGTPPYTYNFLVGNTVSGISYVSNIVGTYATSTSFSFAINAIEAAQGKLTFSANVVDSATTNVLTGVGTNIIGVNTIISLTQNSISNSTADQGQKELLTIGVSGGTSPYTYNYLVYNSQSGAVIFSTILANNAATNTVSFTLPVSASDIGALTFTANVVDSASTNGLTGVGINALTVKAAPSVVLTTNALVDSGQTQVLTATMGSGGAGTFKMQFFNITGSSAFNTVNAVAISGTTTNTFALYSPTSGNVFNWNAIVQDLGTTTPSFEALRVRITVGVDAYAEGSRVSSGKGEASVDGWFRVGGGLWRKPTHG